MAEVEKENHENKEQNNRSSAIYTKNIGPYILSYFDLIQAKLSVKEHSERLNMELIF
jgi:hypothetical protein